MSTPAAGCRHMCSRRSRNSKRRAYSGTPSLGPGQCARQGKRLGRPNATPRPVIKDLPLIRQAMTYQQAAEHSGVSIPTPLRAAGKATRPDSRKIRSVTPTPEWRDHATAPIAKSHYLDALQMLVSTVAEVVTAFFRGRRCGVTINDLEFKKFVLVKPAHRTGKDRIDATIGLPAPQRAIDARVMNSERPLNW
jgi:hypothetical protein